VLERDVAAAFAYHPNDLVAYNEDVMDFVPIPEQRYYERVWLDR
jgi:hypothetical protein